MIKEASWNEIYQWAKNNDIELYEHMTKFKEHYDDCTNDACSNGGCCGGGCQD